jgi:hypothetical protein
MPGCSTTSSVVGDGLDPDQLIDGARRLAARHGTIHRVLGILEALQVQLARSAPPSGSRAPTPDRRSVPRQGAHEGRAAPHGLPCARHRLIRTWADAEDFVAEVGLPAGAQAAGRHGLQGDLAHPQRRRAAGGAAGAARLAPSTRRWPRSSCAGASTASRPSPSDGEVRATSVSRYYPTPLEVMETPWIQWVVVLPAGVEAPSSTTSGRWGRAR